MKAMILNGVVSMKENSKPLVQVEMPIPEPGPGEILLKVGACGVCHTELDEIEGRTPPPEYPIILGHEVVGRVCDFGPNATKYKEGDRVGVGWIYSACGECAFCQSGQENLCQDFRGTGRDANGGYAEYMVIHEDYVCPIPELFSDIEAAPFLCAGAIGYRSLNLSHIKDGDSLGLTGFGASAHLVLKIVKYKYPQSDIFVFARNPKEREFSKELGAVWAGDTTDISPSQLNAIIDTTPVWKPVVEALKNLTPGGRLVINAIRKENTDRSEFQKLDYARDLWMEKEVKSVANVARTDIQGFLSLAAEIPIRPEVQTYALEEANIALTDLKAGQIRGAKVLSIGT